MRITQRQLRRVIRKAIHEAKEPMTPDYVKRSMMGKGAVSGKVFMDTALDAVANGDYWSAANAIMDGLWIDDPPRGADEELSDLLAKVEPLSEPELSTLVADWGTRHFRG